MPHVGWAPWTASPGDLRLTSFTTALVQPLPWPAQLLSSTTCYSSLLILQGTIAYSPGVVVSTMTPASTLMVAPSTEVCYVYERMACSVAFINGYVNMALLTSHLDMFLRRKSLKINQH